MIYVCRQTIFSLATNMNDMNIKDSAFRFTYISQCVKVKEEAILFIYLSGASTSIKQQKTVSLVGPELERN